MTNFKPLNDRILIEMAPKEGIVNGIVRIQETRPQYGWVLAVGPKAKDVKVGDKIQFALGAFQPIKGSLVGLTDEKDYAILEEKVIIGVYDND